VDFLSPAKLLVILVVALAVLGPDKLPILAKQVGTLWRDFSRFRQKLESDVRTTFPDLPSTETVAKAVRAPLSFLDSLADAPATSGGQEADTPKASGSPHVVTSEIEFRDSGANWPAETVTASESQPARAPVLVREPAGVVHEVRSDGGGSHPDPGSN
jgi:Sec-independent protein translocase protein TatA